MVARSSASASDAGGKSELHNIENVLINGITGTNMYTDSYRTERDEAENKDTDYPTAMKSTVEAIEYWCFVPGSMLA